MRWLSASAPKQPAHPFDMLTNLGPSIFVPEVEHLTVVGLTGVVIFDAPVEKQIGSLCRRFPPRRNTASRGLSAEVGQELVCLCENVSLLLDSHFSGLRVNEMSDGSNSDRCRDRRAYILVTVPVKTNFVASVAHSGHLLGECFQRVTRDEPCCCQAVLLEELQQAGHTDFSGVHTACNVVGRVFTSI